MESINSNKAKLSFLSLMKSIIPQEIPVFTIWLDYILAQYKCVEQGLIDGVNESLDLIFPKWISDVLQFQLTSLFGAEECKKGLKRSSIVAFSPHYSGNCEIESEIVDLANETEGSSDVPQNDDFPDQQENVHSLNDIFCSQEFGNNDCVDIKPFEPQPSRVFCEETPFNLTSDVKLEAFHDDTGEDNERESRLISNNCSLYEDSETADKSENCDYRLPYDSSFASNEKSVTSSYPDITSLDYVTSSTNSQMQQIKDTQRYICPDCSCGFSDANVLKKHFSLAHGHKGVIRMGEGEKFWTCHYCGKRSTRMDNAWQHVLGLHCSRLLFCPFCGRGFSFPSNLKHHVKYVHRIDSM